jgi:tetratricopeptide (TPR) repeat protein
MSAPIDTASELTKQNPWPGLRAFGENDRDFFFGRGRETLELLALVQRSPVVVLYGQSGLGKTSLLQAGLFPRLKELNFLPFRVRFDHGDDAPPLARQITLAVAAEFDRAQIKGPRPADGETLWEYFHRVDVDFWGPRNRLLTPVIVLDQFEEIFTLGHRSEKSSARAAEFQKELEAQLEHRPPDAVRERLEAHPDEALRYDLKKQAVKFVITLREDFLPDLDPWRDRMPSLLPNRFRLERMTGEQALDVILCGGGDLVDLAVARDIVDFVSASRRKRSARSLEEREVEPALLSVVCDALNLSRIEHGNARITADLLTAKREEIIQDFYERTFQGVDPRVRDWVEDRLLTSSGYRDRAALDDATQLGLPESDFDLLVNRRILHREERDGVIWLELTHDLLSDPAARSRAVREQRIQAEAAKDREKAAAEREAQVRSKLRRTQLVVAICGVLLVIAGVALDRAIVATRKARAAESEAKTAEANAVQAQANSEASYGSALEITGRMESNIDDSGIPTATVIKDIDDVERAYAHVANQVTSSDLPRFELQHAQFLTRAADAYYRVGYLSQGLAESQQALDLLEKINGSDIAGDVQLTRAEALYSRGHGLVEMSQIAEARQCLEDAIKFAVPAQSPESRQAAARVNVLSRIELAFLDEQVWSYPSANSHLQDALAIIRTIKPNGSDADANEVLSWTALADQRMGQSPTPDAGSLQHLADAAAVMKTLMARDPQNLRWKRMFEHMVALEGATAMNLDRTDQAKPLLEQAQTISEDLCQRDPLNLDWRLGLLESDLSLGALQEGSGELDLAQESLEKAQSEAAQFATAQPAWTQAVLYTSVVNLKLGDVLRSKYADETDPKEKTLLLQSAFSVFGQARAWSEKGMQLAPENMFFVESASGPIARQGQVMADEADAVDLSVKGNLDVKNEKETEALKYYADAYEKFLPVERAAKDEPRTLDDEAYFHAWVGNALMALNRTADAVTAYQQMAAAAKNLVVRKPDGGSYKFLAVAYELLGRAYAVEGKLDDAAANDRLAEDAIRHALLLKPDSTGFHADDAQIQIQLFGISFQRNDLPAAIDDLDRGITTSLAALKTDYSAPLLNQDIGTFGDDLTEVQTALKTGQPAQGSPAPRSHLSPEQSANLLQRITDLRAEIAPDKILDHDSRQIDWTLRPLMPGAWLYLDDADRDAAIKNVLALNQTLKPDQVWGIRRLPLNFYDDVTLYEAEVAFPDGTHGIAAYVQHGANPPLAIQGTQATLIALNREAQLKLDTVDRAADYMRFYVGVTQCSHGCVDLIDAPNDLNWRSEATAKQRAAVGALIKPLTAEPISDRGWQGIATWQSNGYLGKAGLHLDRFGHFKFFNDHQISPERLPVYIQAFQNGIRVSLSPEAFDRQGWAAQATKLEQTLKANPTDATALQQLPPLYYELGRWNDAVELQKKWLALVQSAPKHDAAWTAQLNFAYRALALYQLYARDFDGVLASTDEAIKLDPTILGPQANHATALLFLGRISEAEAIFLRYRGQKINPNDRASTAIWEDQVDANFDALQKAGIITPDVAPEFAHIRDLLKPPSN